MSITTTPLPRTTKYVLPSLLGALWGLGLSQGMATEYYHYMIAMALPTLAMYNAREHEKTKLKPQEPEETIERRLTHATIHGGLTSLLTLGTGIGLGDVLGSLM